MKFNDFRFRTNKNNNNKNNTENDKLPYTGTVDWTWFFLHQDCGPSGRINWQLKTPSDLANLDNCLTSKSLLVSLPVILKITCICSNE